MIVHMKNIILQMLQLNFLVKVLLLKKKNHTKLISQEMNKINKILKSIKEKNLNYVVYVMMNLTLKTKLLEILLNL